MLSTAQDLGRVLTLPIYWAKKGTRLFFFFFHLYRRGHFRCNRSPFLFQVYANILQQMRHDIPSLFASFFFPFKVFMLLTETATKIPLSWCNPLWLTGLTVYWGDGDCISRRIFYSAFCHVVRLEKAVWRIVRFGANIVSWFVRGFGCFCLFLHWESDDRSVFCVAWAFSTDLSFITFVLLAFNRSPSALQQDNKWN